MTRLLFVLVCAAAVAAAGCDSGQGAKPAPAPATPEKAASAQPAGPPPEAPAAQAPARAPAADPPEAKPLPEGPAAAAVLVSSGYSPPPKGREIDNSRCHVCHGNFTDEPLAVSHAKQGVGCERCHGACDDHCGDEGNITPPSTMFAKADIDKSCKVCHPDDRFVEGAKSCPVVVLEEGKYCTDCHGRHQMECRTVRWDKKTGALLPKVVEKR